LILNQNDFLSSYRENSILISTKNQFKTAISQVTRYPPCNDSEQLESLNQKGRYGK